MDETRREPPDTGRWLLTGVAAYLAFLCVALGACTPAAQVAPGAGSPAPQSAPAPASDIIRVSSGGPEDEVLVRCLGDLASSPRLEIEPHAAADPSDPDHVVASWMVAGGAIQAAASFDGGRTWTPPRTLPFNTCSGGPFDFLPRASDPWVAIGPEGRVYVSAIAYQPTETVDAAGAVIVQTSGDGGRTWDPPGVATITHTPEFFHDNTAIVADPKNPGTAYVLTTRYEPPSPLGPVTFSKTVDGGRTWSPMRPITPRTPGSPPARAPQMVIDPRSGHLFVFFTHGPGGSRMSLVRSEDGGATWSQPLSVTEGDPIRRPPPKYPGTDKEIAIAEDIASFLIDPRTGRLFAVFTDGRFTEGRAPHVGLVTSGDGGRTWNSPLRLSAEAATASWRPALAIDSQGRVAVHYFAPTPDAPVQGSSLPVGVHVVEIQIRPDGSPTLGRDTVVDAFAWTPTPRGRYFLGDYHGFVAVRDGFLPVYGRPSADGSRTVALPPGSTPP